MPRGVTKPCIIPSIAHSKFFMFLPSSSRMAAEIFVQNAQVFIFPPKIQKNTFYAIVFNILGFRTVSTESAVHVFFLRSLALNGL